VWATGKSLKDVLEEQDKKIKEARDRGDGETAALLTARLTEFKVKVANSSIGHEVAIEVAIEKSTKIFREFCKLEDP
jgi:hypothetical protein